MRMMKKRMMFQYRSPVTTASGEINTSPNILISTCKNQIKIKLKSNKIKDDGLLYIFIYVINMCLTL